MKIWYGGFVLIALVVLGGGLGCSAKMDKKDGSEAKKESAAPETGMALGGRAARQDDRGKAKVQLVNQENLPKDAQPAERKIIYTATLKLQVEDFPKSEGALLQLIDDHKGQLEQADVTGRRGSSREGRWKIRIAPERRAAFQKAVLKLGEAQQNNLTSQDVSEEYVDLTVRIANKESQVKSLQELFNKTKTTDENLNVRKVLDQATEELERYKGRKRYLENLTSLATVNVHLYERGIYVPDDKPDFGTNVGRTFFGSLNALSQTGQFLALVVVALTPWLPFLAVFGLTIYVFWRRQKRGGPVVKFATARQSAAPPPAEPLEPIVDDNP